MKIPRLGQRRSPIPGSHPPFTIGNSVALKTGVSALRKRGELPEHLKADVSNFAQQLLADQGGEANCSALRMGLIRRIVEMEGLCRLLAIDIEKRGIHQGRFKYYMLAVKNFNTLAAQLGLERKAKSINSLEQYITKRRRDGS